jgi:hypothetical protein
MSADADERALDRGLSCITQNARMAVNRTVLSFTFADLRSW